MLKPAFAGLAFLLAIPLASQAAVPLKDDLTACKLPHGEVVLKVLSAADPAKGNLLNLADGTFSVLPGAGGEKPVNRAQIAPALLEKRGGDLELLPDDSMTLWAVSGRIVEAGNRYLYELAAMKFDRPALIPGNAKLPAGLMPEVKEGRAYLVETTDKHYALVRVLELSNTAVTLQYVYQPSGAISFDIPEAPPIELHADKAIAETPATTEPALPPLPPTAPVGSAGTPGSLVLHIGEAPVTPAANVVLEPYLATHLQQRTLLIDTRMKILKAPARTAAEIDKKVNAINDLVSLRAGPEAASALVDQIAFTNPNAKPVSGSADALPAGAFPCLDALKQLGKPASHAALQELRHMNPAETADNLQDSQTRATLLGLVIRSVEGNVVGEFILQRERDATKDPARRALLDKVLSAK